MMNNTAKTITDIAIETTACKIYIIVPVLE